MTFLRWQCCLSLLVADFNSRIICQRQPEALFLFNENVYGLGFRCLYGRGYWNFSFLSAPEPWTKREQIERKAGGGGGKGWVEQASFIIEVNGSRYGTTVVLIISASVYYAMLRKALSLIFSICIMEIGKVSLGVLVINDLEPNKLLLKKDGLSALIVGRRGCFALSNGLLKSHLHQNAP
ncbi:hypothetical protein CEXT_96111 [Caerostris extrusa]|uniref:Uncharacterized protein n=1 Tax=Caerostris extrusa TaxID=172846 RepID=A0AAV4W285_CAEEX|nr:hypothetical protein CEXT_96111 [Caerostris extrusa]